MLALRIQLLTGRYVATAYNDRRRAEWPPHPARVFSALVATHCEAEPPDPAERAALAWLETQPAPEIVATDAAPRDVVDVFVPVNDAAVLDDLAPRLNAVDDAEAALAGLASGDKQVKRATAAVDKARAALAAAIARAVAPVDGKVPADRARLALSLLPDRRVRQARTFPSVTPEEPVVTLVWRAAEPAGALRDALDRLAGRVVRVGHSSSLVSVRVLPADADVGRARWVPDPDGVDVLRVVAPGQLDRLDEAYARHRGVAPRVMPAAFQAYAAPRPAAPALAHSSWGDDWIVLGRDAEDDEDDAGNPRLPAWRAVDVARAVRDALMKYADPQPAPELLTGHGADGAPSERGHLAIVGLPFVGHPHADGLLRGVALVLPRDATADERRLVLRAVGRWEAAAGLGEHVLGEPRPVPVLLGAAGVLRLRRVTGGGLAALEPRTWSAPATLWASVTPLALDRHPGDLWRRDAGGADAVARARELVADACVRLGLPRPAVEVMPYAPVVAGEKIRRFPPFPPVAGRPRRVLTHATLRFDEPVAGPILVGAGRYHGLGLMRPLPGDRS